MQVIDAGQVNALLTLPALIAALRQDFAAAHQMPQRQLLPLGPVAGQALDNHDAIALLPAWNDRFISCKLFSYFPDNPAQGLPLLHARLLLLARQTGVPLALFEARSLTNFRTAAVSALAASYLAKSDARELLIIGTGQLLPYFIRAYLAVRPLTRIAVAGRCLAKTTAVLSGLTEQLTADLAQDGNKGALPELCAVSLQADEVARADIISCISAATTPLFPADWVQAGTLIDAVGNHRQDVSEIDPQLVASAAVYVDSRVNCLAEAGELLLPAQQGLLAGSVGAHIVQELADLCRANQLRASNTQRQVFKAVGTALADLSAAALVWQQLTATQE